jgi:class 3 adenylate cyclase
MPTSTCSPPRTKLMPRAIASLSQPETSARRRGSHLLASAEVRREAGENDRGSQSLGLVQLKGRDEPIEIYRLA